MDVSDRRLQVQLTQEARIAPAFLWTVPCSTDREIKGLSENKDSLHGFAPKFNRGTTVI